MTGKLVGIIYRFVLKPLLFLRPADEVHERFLMIGGKIGRRPVLKKVTAFFLGKFSNSILSQEIAGLKFRNPIGLAAGFDYDADLVKVLPAVGFGFHTVGTVTLHPYAGNPRPMLGRLPKSKSLLVNKGFRNSGIKNILPKLPNKSAVPYGLSIGSTNKIFNSFDEIVSDIQESFMIAVKNKDVGYFELNISCPNLVNVNLDKTADSPSGLKNILDSLQTLNVDRPLFIKMPLEKTLEQTDELVSSAQPYNFVTGLIFSNLAKDRNNSEFNHDEILKAGKGNFSGKPTFAKSNELIRFFSKKYGDRFIIIGCGGVFTAQDAYKKIKLGASLVQLVTGLVYMGPAQINEINRGLAKLIDKDGFNSIQEVVGSESL